ncbi:MAG: phosphatidylserine synthase [Chitinophagales bacterium]|nr:MAG: phosphatidylserine synthase [Chitinophagales bacterium]
MKLKENIANFFTLMNLVCGVVAILNYWDLKTMGLLVFAGALFDFADGFVARALKITSELGKQLDSLSDMVTFGVVPGVIAYWLLGSSGFSFIAVMIPVFSAVRLGKFNIDAQQTQDFIGLPTPANALFWASLAIIFFDMGKLTSTIQNNVGSGNFYHWFHTITANNIFLISAVLITTMLLVAPLRLMGMKFKLTSWNGNEMKFALITISLVLMVFLQFYAAPFILLLYIFFSIIHFYILHRHEIQS